MEQTTPTTISESPAQDCPVEPTTANDEPFLEIKYQKEKMGLSKEQAVTLAQKGMHYDSVYKKLSSLAEKKGVTPNVLIENLLSDAKQTELEKYKGIFADGVDEQEIADYANYKAQKQIAADKTDTLSRIADEFLQMKEDFSDEIQNISDLDERVLAAAQEGMPLAFAYLLYKHFDNKAKLSAEQQKSSAENLLGTLADNNTTNPVEDRFLRSLWGR